MAYCLLLSSTPAHYMSTEVCDLIARNSYAAGHIQLAVMMMNSPESESEKKMTSTKKLKPWQKARGRPRRASTQRRTHCPQGPTPLLRGLGPSPQTLRRTEGLLPTEARLQRTPGSTTGTSSKRQPCGARGKCRKQELALLAVMVGNRLVSSLASLAASGFDATECHTLVSATTLSLYNSHSS